MLVFFYPFMRLFILIIFFPLLSVYSQNECPPCEIIINSRHDYNKRINYKWPKINPIQKLK